MQIPGENVESHCEAFVDPHSLFCMHVSAQWYPCPTGSRISQLGFAVTPAGRSIGQFWETGLHDAEQMRPT